MKTELPTTFKAIIYTAGRWIGKNATPELAGQVILACVNLGSVVAMFTPTTVDDIVVKTAGPTLRELSQKLKDAKDDDEGLAVIDALNKFFDGWK